MLVLSHFKGHPMRGFGGALKNISIGLASSHGKAYIHGVGKPHLLECIESRNGVHTAEAAAKIGVGTREYELIEVQ